MWNIGDIFESCYNGATKDELFKIIEIDPINLTLSVDGKSDD